MQMRIPNKRKYMKDVQFPDPRRPKDTLCWDCGRALRAGCSWSDPERQKPVNGWQAKKTRMGYIVQDCPCFERCSWCAGRYRTAEDYIFALEKAVKQKTNRADYYEEMNRKYRDVVMKLKWQLTVHMCD